MPPVSVIVLVQIPLVSGPFQWISPFEGYNLFIGRKDLFLRLIQLDVYVIYGNVLVVPFLLLIPISSGMVIFSLRTLLTLLSRTWIRLLGGRG